MLNCYFNFRRSDRESNKLSINGVGSSTCGRIKLQAYSYIKEVVFTRVITQAFPRWRKLLWSPYPANITVNMYLQRDKRKDTVKIYHILFDFNMWLSQEQMLNCSKSCKKYFVGRGSHERYNTLLHTCRFWIWSQPHFQFLEIYHHDTNTISKYTTTYQE